jgi:hypothetical protein
MFLKHVQKGQIRTLIATLENVFEIADRLMSVNDQRKMEFGRHGDCLGLRYSS